MTGIDEMTWQQALTWYVAIGVVTFIVVFATYYFITSKSTEARLHKALDEIRDRQNELSNRDNPRWKRGIEYTLEKIVAPALAVLLIVTAWPLAIWSKARELWIPEPSETAKEKEFAVEQEDLIGWQDLDDLETRERVTDPLGAVPELPFGHLNPAWLKFKAKRGPGDSIWTFSAQWAPRWGGKELREGYVIVGPDGIGPHFLTARRVLEIG